MTTNSADHDPNSLWIEAWHTLHAQDRRPLVNAADVDHLLALLPERSGHESSAAWLARLTAQATSAKVIPFPVKARNFKPMTEFFRMAADSGSERLPLPDTTLESADGRLWLTVTKDGEELVLTVQAVGMAIDDLSGKTVGLAAKDDADTLLLVVELDDQAEGTCRVADDEAVRAALLHPVIGLVDAGEP